MTRTTEHDSAIVEGSYTSQELLNGFPLCIFKYSDQSLATDLDLFTVKIKFALHCNQEETPLFTYLKPSPFKKLQCFFFLACISHCYAKVFNVIDTSDSYYPLKLYSNSFMDKMVTSHINLFFSNKMLNFSQRTFILIRINIEMS